MNICPMCNKRPAVTSNGLCQKCNYKIVMRRKLATANRRAKVVGYQMTGGILG